MIHFVLFALSLHHICIQSSSSTTKTCYDVWNHFTLSQKADALTNQTDVYTLSNNVSVRCSFVDLGDNTSFIGALSEYGSLANHNTSLRCIMTQDCPFNQYDLETGESLKLYRWSLDRIISYRNHSIYHSFDEQPYLFMTCNRNLTLIKDYMLMPFHEDFVNATLTLHKACYHIKQANIRGYQCKDDVGNFWSGGHFHTQSYSCFCGGCCSWQSGAVYSEDHFGWYKFTNPLFSCTADSGSTTDYWIGSIVKVNLEPTSYPTIDPTTDPTIDTTSPSATPSEAPSDAPTAAPTSVSAAPSYSPTVVPTITPTRFPSDTPTHPPTSPTDTPSASPTKAPSNDPTTHPSLSPSRAPSLAPTLAPSVAPSMAPSNAPTTPPTIAPTNPPTNAPSLAPSQSPTACVDYFNYTSLDGIDVLNDVTPHNHAFPLDAAVQKHIPTTNDHFVRETILCDNNDAKDENICFIGCYQVGLCALSSIECAPNTIWKEIRVVCTEDVCLYLNVNITDTTVDTLTILCDGRFACDGLQLTINAASNIDVSVDCNEAFSCNDMVIHLMHDPDKDASDDDINVDITCYADSSCDGALITTDHSENIYINLNALRYSDDIRILHHFWRNIKVNCAFNGDRRYIRYDTDNLLRNYEILELARDEYRQRKLPCEDIKIYCSNNEHFERECEYKYALHNISSSDILNGEAKPNCYWLEIGQLYKATCKGTCGDQMIYTKYNKTFALSFYLGGNQDTDDDDDDEQRRRRLQGNTDQNMTNLTESYRTCDEYFGTINATDDSLSSIDAIYADVLNVMISFDDFVIHDILSPPYTILQNGLEQIECTNEGANTVSIMTNVTIESAESTEAVIGRVFASDGLFINKSAAFLSKFFGIPITILSPDEVHVLNVSQGFSTSVIIAIVLSAFFVIIGILFFVFKSYKKREREKEELTTYVRNPLVLFVGISQYDEAPTNPQVDGFFRSLDGIDVDARNVNRLFGDQLNYTVFPKDSQLKWSGEQLMAFLTEKADLLESNVRTIYDGLVVILSCHGITDHIVTSDYKTIKKSAVHRLFTAQKPKSREIPRVFIFDCCDGADTREAGVLRDEEESDEEQLKAVVKPENPGHVALASDQYPVRPKREGLRKVDSAKNIERALSTNAGTAGSWLEEEKNPDYQLITIYAANEGFQSKLDIHKGSYVITEFVERMSQNVENGNQKWIFEVFDEIQSVLHRKGKQLTDNKYNNNMRYLKFVRNHNLLGGLIAESADDIDATHGMVSAQEGEEIELQVVTQTKGPNSNEDEAQEEDTVDEAEDTVDEAEDTVDEDI
eukprot:1039957_1